MTLGLVDGKSRRHRGLDGGAPGSQSLRRERRLRRSLELLHGGAVRIIEAPAVNDVYQTCLDVAEAILGGVDGAVGVVEGNNVVFRYVTSGLREGYTGFSVPLDGGGVVNRAIKSGAPVYVPDVSQDDEYVKPGGLTTAREFRSELAVPVTVDGVAVAVLNFESTEPDGFDVDARKLTEMLSLYASTAVKRIKALEQDRVWAEKLEALHSGAVSISEAPDPAEVYRTAIGIIRDHFGFPWAGIGEVQGEWLRYVYYSGVSIEGHEGVHLSRRSVMVRAYRTGETQLVRDTRADPDYLSLRDEGVRFLSEVAVPVRVDGEVRAVINVESVEPDAFTEGDRRLLELLALHVSSSLGRLNKLVDLERQVALKTGELLDAERLAAVGRVASMVAHDLRSPLQSIRNASYLVRRDPSRAAEMCPVIDEAVAYASKMVEDLRESVAPVRLKRAPVNLVELVAGAVDAVEAPTGVRVIRDLAGEFLAANVDAVRLRRAVENLVKNAAEAMPGGGVLTVRLLREGDDAVITVGDTGGGIPEEARPSIFKPFYSTKPRGTGLGLAIAKQSVEAHGGSITYESRPGEGTVFTVRVPLRAGR